MTTRKEIWDLLILDGLPPVNDLGSMAVADIDGDGQLEMVLGSFEELYWFRPSTLERGTIARMRCHVGLALEDVDGDGRLEVFAGGDGDPQPLCFYKMGERIEDPWTKHTVDPLPVGGAHDLLFCDVDGDGRRELIANSLGRGHSAVHLYKPGTNPLEAWQRYVVQDGYFQEGIVAADLDGDGRIEIVSGPDLFAQPPGGPFSGPWVRSTLARGFREMVRVDLVDITGNGRMDVVMAESEFFEGRMSWFENRMAEDPANPWIEHPLAGNLYYAHSMSARRDPKSGKVRVFIAEMAEGGWSAPRNYDARLMEYRTSNNGKSWTSHLLYQGSGTHQAIACDIDGDGREEIVGKQWKKPKVQIWKRRTKASPLTNFRHRLLDRDKKAAATDILAADLTANGKPDIICGDAWYEHGSWQRRQIPGIAQVIAAYDIDADGRQELIATTGPGLNSQLVWLRPVDPLNDRWQMFDIGTGHGDWPHGTCIAPLLPDGKLALICAYHSAEQGHAPELFEVPADPTAGPWPKRLLADIPYGEEIVAADLRRSGQLDLVAGRWWLENLGDGTFRPHEFAPGFKAARVAVADFNGNGRLDILLGEEVIDFQNKVTPYSRLAWFENPGRNLSGQWNMHIVDSVRCAHSISVADLDGDGRPEIICGEHDPFRPYRSRCRLLVYKKQNRAGRTWWRWTLDDRFEHHDGAKAIELHPGRWAIMSHGWKDSRYVHLWEAF